MAAIRYVDKFYVVTKSQLMSSTLYDCMRAAKMEQREGEISVKKNMKTESVEPSPTMKERAF